MSELRVSKYVATAIITDPALVTAECASRGQIYDNGAIWVYIPELNLVGVDMIYCRYGLSIPYFRVQIGDTILVEPTVGEDERWFYTGLVDCAGNIPVTADQLLIQLLSQVIYATTAGTMHLSSKTAIEAFIKGTTALVELTKHQQLISQLQSAINGWVPVPNDGGAALKAALAAFLALPLPDYSGVLSTKIFGE